MGAIGAFALVTAAKAGRDAIAAKGALLRAETQLSARNLDPARAELTSADASLKAMGKELDHLGPLLPLSKLVPIVRSQVIAVQTFQSAGVTLTEAGLRLSDAAQKVLESNQGQTPLAGALDKLRNINASLAEGAASVQKADREVEGLKGRWLIGPIATARNDLLDRLPKYTKQATDTEQGLDALIRFAGGDGDRRYLFLNQNPDEIRPTGGFIGTYGLITAKAGQLALERFEPTPNFSARHPDAGVPADQAGSPFRFAVPPVKQTWANSNSTADFAKAGKLAVDIWNGAGEDPVDGAISVTPAFLARILAVLGPVDVPDYGEHVDAGNLIDRFDYYTEQVELNPTADTSAARKGFVSSLAQAVMERVLAAPSSQWQALGEAVGKGFEAREVMAWAADPKVQAALVDRHWDGTLPKVAGDFYYSSEFSYAAKIDRSLRRVYTHTVEIQDDGSAKVTTTMTVTNPREPNILNPGSLSYVTVYGPTGATLDPASDTPYSQEPALVGHPAAGWFVNAPAFGTASLKTVWNVKNVLVDGKKGIKTFSLTFLHPPDHTGDVLNLNVKLPPGYEWKGAAPPTQISLDQDVKGTWTMGPISIGLGPLGKS